jgi:hypothetical protein
MVLSATLPTQFLLPSHLDILFDHAYCQVWGEQHRADAAGLATTCSHIASVYTTD